MNYELAKKLKDAGLKLLLPSGAQKAGLCKHNLWGYEDRISCDCTPEDHAPIPKLEELIEACGVGLQSLINNTNNHAQDFEGGWIAFTNRKNGQGERMEIWGKTPSEAMANLYLTLQKND